MASEGPTKADINAIFKRLRSIPTNKQCFDCGAMNPTWASVTYGVFLCLDCSAVHRSLGVHVTFIRSTQLDTNWTWLQLRAMQVGGNANAVGFFRQHGCTSNDAQQKYNSRAAHMYREKLHSLALKAVKQHGSKATHKAKDKKGQIHLEGAVLSPSPKTKDVDFFSEHEKIEDASNGVQRMLLDEAPKKISSEPMSISNGNSNGNGEAKTDELTEGAGPNVDVALSMSPTQAQQFAEPRKPTIGARKTAPKKSGLGAKKGLGAQKVKSNFAEIESEAAQRDKEREELAKAMVMQEAKTKEEEQKRLASLKLAYKDLDVEEKKRDASMKAMDPKKAAQMERLGMGYSGSRGVSHSALTSMETIEQMTPTSNKSYDRYSSRGRDEDDDFEMIGGGFSSGPPKYNDSPFGLKKEDRYSSKWGSGSSSTSKGWDDLDRFEKKSSSSSLIDEFTPPKNEEEDKGRSRKNFEASDSNEAQKKFGNAKAISSDQYFGNRDPDLEMRQNLAKYEGSSSLSSAQLFGTGETSSSSASYSSGPDLQDIKDGVRQGVTKVAGKISNLANGVISSIQDHYG